MSTIVPARSSMLHADPAHPTSAPEDRPRRRAYSPTSSLSQPRRRLATSKKTLRFGSSSERRLPSILEQALPSCLLSSRAWPHWMTACVVTPPFGRRSPAARLRKPQREHADNG